MATANVLPAGCAIHKGAHSMTEQEEERRAEAQRDLAIKIAAKQLGVTAAGLAEAIDYVEAVASDPWTDDEFEALQ